MMARPGELGAPRAVRDRRLSSPVPLAAPALPRPTTPRAFPVGRAGRPQRPAKPAPGRARRLHRLHVPRPPACPPAHCDPVRGRPGLLRAHGTGGAKLAAAAWAAVTRRRRRRRGSAGRVGRRPARARRGTRAIGRPGRRGWAGCSGRGGLRGAWHPPRRSAPPPAAKKRASSSFPQPQGPPAEQRQRHRAVRHADQAHHVLPPEDPIYPAARVSREGGVLAGAAGRGWILP
jgi:hypothetical protein